MVQLTSFFISFHISPFLILSFSYAFPFSPFLCAFYRIASWPPIAYDDEILSESDAFRRAIWDQISDDL